MTPATIIAQPKLTRVLQRSRDAIATAAESLFSLHGFDGVTTQQVADLAGVSQRTLFRHFATKEDLVFGWLDRYITLAGERIGYRQANESMPEILRRAFDPICHLPREDAAKARLVERLTADSVILQAGLNQRFAIWEEVVAHALQKRAIGTQEAAFLGGIAIRIAAVAFRLSGSTEDDLETLIDEGFRVLKRYFGGSETLAQSSHEFQRGEHAEPR